MFKNLYSSGEYSIKDTPYKLRGSFLSKAEKLENETLEKKAKEVSPGEKMAIAREELDRLETAVASKKEEISGLQADHEKLKIKTSQEISLMLKEAGEQAESLKARKEKEGYDSGFEKGYFEGLEKSKAEVEQKYASLISTITSISQGALAEKQKLVMSAEDDIVKLSVDIAKKVVGQELSINHDIIVNFVKEAIRMLENKEKIVIYVHPDDIEIIKSHREDFQKLMDISDTMHILPDDMLSRGECRLESESEIVDTDINYQFEEINKKLQSKE